MVNPPSGSSRDHAVVWISKAEPEPVIRRRPEHGPIVTKLIIDGVPREGRHEQGVGAQLVLRRLTAFLFVSAPVALGDKNTQTYTKPGGGRPIPTRFLTGAGNDPTASMALSRIGSAAVFWPLWCRHNKHPNRSSPPNGMARPGAARGALAIAIDQITRTT